MPCPQPFRMICRRPLLSAAIVLTIGVCIGALTAVFTIVDATLLRPLPYLDPERLAYVSVRSEFEGAVNYQLGHDGRTWEAFRDNAKTIDLAVFSRSTSEVNFRAESGTEHFLQQRIGAGFFRVFGVPPIAGREFSAEEDASNGPAVVILSHALWQRSFRGDYSVVGRDVLVAGLTSRVIGIASPAFESDAQLWVPLRAGRTGEGGGTNFTVVGRLRAGITRTQAEAELASIGQTLLENRRLRAGMSQRYGLLDLREPIRATFEAPLLLILAATLVVLLIGCFNIAGMLLAQGASRQSEIATRMALGASRRSIIRQLLMESFALALSGGASGILIGYFSLGIMKSILPTAFSSLSKANLDLRVMGAVAGISLLTSFVFGLFPALQAGKVDIRTAQLGRGIAGRKSILRTAFSTIQITAAVALLIAAGLLIRSFDHLWDLDPGFDPRDVTTGQFNLRDVRYSNPEQWNRYYRDALARLQAIPGVQSAAVTLSLPYERALNTNFRRPGDDPAGNTRLTNISYASPQLFDALRIPLLKGRVFTDNDGAGTPPVAVVNEAFVRMHINDEEPVGVELRFGSNVVQVVGVVADTLQQGGWGNFGVMGRIPGVYVPATQFRSGFPVHTVYSPSWVVRTSGPVVGLQRQIEDALSAVDPLLPVSAFRSVDQVKLRTLAMQRFMATLIGIAAALALLLAALGTYAMISNSVAERTRELGIRLALGATTWQTVRDSARPGVICAAVGLVAGLVLARTGTRLLQGMLYGVTPADTFTYIAVSAGVLLMAAFASLIPALRITTLDPSQTLRQD